MRRILPAFALVAGLVAVETMGCTFHVDGVALGVNNDASVQDLAGADLGDADLSPPPPTDLAGLCTGGANSGCASDGTTLLVCENGAPVSTVCEDGCSSDGIPHCKHFDPGGVAEPSDYLANSLVDVVIPAGETAVFNTDTGAISLPARPGGTGNMQGIGFRQATQAGTSISVGIFSMKSLTVADSAIINVVGSRPIAIVTSGDIIVDGTIDVLGSCVVGAPVAGGSPGGAAKMLGGNAGGGVGGGGPGLLGAGAGGGGGGGHGEAGGAGATSAFDSAGGGAGGIRFGDLSVVDPVLVGGSGGGSGAGGAGVLGGAGGSGGGALQLASNGGLTLGSSAIIQAGGCHGSPGSGGNPIAGGGGGAGGSVLLEGRTLTLVSGATIAANGGGGAGGGGGGGGAGEDGPDNQDAAAGGSAGSGGPGSEGGNGGHTTSLSGDPGAAPSGGQQGGGGGGGVGRIALKSKTGGVSMMGALLSPEIGETQQGHPSPATVGAAQFK